MNFGEGWSGEGGKFIQRYATNTQLVVRYDPKETRTNIMEKLTPISNVEIPPISNNPFRGNPQEGPLAQVLLQKVSIINSKLLTF